MLASGLCRSSGSANGCYGKSVRPVCSMKIRQFLTDSFFERLKQEEYLAIAVVFI